MKTSDARLRAKALEVYISKIESAKSETVENFLTRYPRGHGVYLVCAVDDDTVIYVGRSVRHVEGLAGRIYDHCYVKEPGNLIVKLAIPRDDLKQKYIIRHLLIDDPIERRDVEYYFIALFRPKFNKWN